MGITSQGTEHFYRLITVPPNTPETTIMSNVCSQKVLRELIGLPIMDPRLSTTKKIANALDMYLEDLMLRLDEQPSDRQNRAETKHLRLMKKKLVRLLLKHTRACAKTEGHMRRTADSEVIERLPDSEKVHRAAFGAMIDLYHLHSAFAKSDKELPMRVRSAVQVQCAAAIFLLTDHGRPGEWEHMKSSDVAEMEKYGRDYLIAKDHKTVQQFGPLAKYCPPATQHALKLVCTLPSRGSGLLMEPPKWVPRPPQEEIMTVASTKILRKCCAVYLPNEEEMWVPLERKQQHCLTDEDRRDRDAAMANRCSLDGHGVGMAKTYTATSLSKSALRAREEYEQHHGPPPGSPTHEEGMRKEPESRPRWLDGVSLEHPRAHVSMDSDTESSSAWSVNADQAQTVAVGDLFDLSTAPNPFGEGDEDSNSGDSADAIPPVSLPNDSSVRSLEADGGSNVTDPPLFHPVPRPALPSEPSSSVPAAPDFSNVPEPERRWRAQGGDDQEAVPSLELQKKTSFGPLEAKCGTSVADTATCDPVITPALPSEPYQHAPIARDVPVTTPALPSEPIQHSAVACDVTIVPGPKRKRRTQAEIANSLAGHHIIRTGGRTYLDPIQIEWVQNELQARG